MIDGITTMIGGVGNAIGAFFKWKSTKNNETRDAEGDVAKARESKEAAYEELNAAVWGGDEQKVNAMLRGCVAGIFAASACWAVGCSSAKPQAVVVSADRWVYAVTNAEGKVDHWRVPPAVMEELVQQRQRVKALEDKIDVMQRTGATASANKGAN